MDDFCERVQVSAPVMVHYPLGPAGGAGSVVDGDRRSLVFGAPRQRIVPGAGE